MSSQSRKYFTYILECSDGTYYTGKTINIEKRLRQHNGILKGGAKYTRVRRPVRLVYQAEFSSHLEACNQEAFIKRLTRLQKKHLSNLQTP